jgi:hypothetical protein
LAKLPILVEMASKRPIDPGIIDIDAEMGDFCQEKLQ